MKHTQGKWCIHEFDSAREMTTNAILLALLEACKAVTKIKGMTGDVKVDNMIHNAIKKAEGK